MPLTPGFPENSIRQASRGEGESEHHSMRCFRSSTCLEYIADLFRSRRRLESRHVEATVSLSLGRRCLDGLLLRLYCRR